MTPDLSVLGSILEDTPANILDSAKGDSGEGLAAWIVAHWREYESLQQPTEPRSDEPRTAAGRQAKARYRAIEAEAAGRHDPEAETVLLDHASAEWAPEATVATHNPNAEEPFGLDRLLNRGSGRETSGPLSATVNSDEP